jgi:hypothetical protein
MRVAAEDDLYFAALSAPQELKLLDLTEVLALTTARRPPVSAPSHEMETGAVDRRHSPMRCESWFQPRSRRAAICKRLIWVDVDLDGQALDDFGKIARRVVGLDR